MKRIVIHCSMLLILALQQVLPSVTVFAFARPVYPGAASPTATAAPVFLPQDDEATLTPTTSPPAEETPPAGNPTLLPTETQLPGPTASPTPLLEDIAPIPTGQQIRLESSPEFITPGGQAFIHWEVVADEAGHGEIAFFLSPGILVAEPDPDGVYDPQANTYRVPFAPRGVFQIEIDAEAEMPVYLDARLGAGTPARPQTQSQAAKAPGGGSLALLQKVTVNQSGGRAEGLRNRVQVMFPEGVLTETAEVFIHHPLRESSPSHSLSGRPFEITARGAQSKRGLDAFSDYVEIEVSYADFDVPPELEGDLYLHWYDPELDAWHALTTVVDTENQVARGFTNHFTVFDIGINNWQANHLPTIDAFQVSQFTGAATYSYPIEVPPGPGGLQPSTVA